MGMAKKWCNDYTSMSFFPSTFNHHLIPMHIFFHFSPKFSLPFRPHMRYWSNVKVEFLKMFKNFHVPPPFGKKLMHLVFVGQENYLECVSGIMPTKGTSSA